MGIFEKATKSKLTKNGRKLSLTFTQLVGLRAAIPHAFELGGLQPEIAAQLVALRAWLPKPPIPHPTTDEGTITAWRSEWQGTHHLTVPGEHLTALAFALKFAFWLATQGLIVGQPIVYQRRIEAIEKLGAVDLLAIAEG